MISDDSCEPDSHPERLPSLLALRAFEAAARHENFSRAAEELHLTHGAVSRAVRLLEDDLGLALFERRQRRVYLNEAGRSLAQAVAQGMEVMRQALRALRARPARAWVLSCEPTLLMRWLIPRWPDFQAQYPGIDIHLMAGGGPFSFDQGIDLAIRRADFPWPAHFQAETLFSEQVGPVCRPDLAAGWKTATRLHTRTRPEAWQQWAALSGQRGSAAAGDSYFEHFYFSLQAAIAGLGVAIGPWQLVRDDVAQGLLAAPEGFAEDGTRYCLLSPAAAPANSPQAALLQWLREQADSDHRPVLG